MEGVRVRGGFTVNAGWEAVKGSPLPNECFRCTDKDGQCKVEGETNNGEAGAAVVGVPAGYYRPLHGDGYTFNHKDIFGVWQPDNLVVTLRVQRIVRPIPLFVKQVGMFRPINSAHDIFPSGGDTLRFDLMKGEYLPPAGNGVVADIEFTRLPRQDFGEGVNGGGVKGQSYRDSMKVRFLGDDNGMFEVPTVSAAALKIRSAPKEEASYKQEYLCWDGYDKKIRHETNYDKNRCLCFRIRTRRNDKGEIVGAYYGKIYGDISFCEEYRRGLPPIPVASVNMRYYLNPTSLDRNLEWNRVNLCPDPGKMNGPEL